MGSGRRSHQLWLRFKQPRISITLPLTHLLVFKLRLEASIIQCVGRSVCLQHKIDNEVAFLDGLSFFNAKSTLALNIVLLQD